MREHARLGRLRQRLARLPGHAGGAARLRRGRRRRRRLGVIGGRRGGRLGVADEDLGPGRQSAMVGGEDDVERVDRATGVLRPVGDGRLDHLLEHDQIAPVAELDTQVRRRGDLRAEDDEIRHRRAHDVGAGRGGLRAGGDALRRHLAVEERDAEDVADRLRAGGTGRARGRARRERARADERAVGREDEGVGDAARGRPRRGCLGRDRRGLAGHEDREAMRAGGDDRRLRGRAGAGRRSGERPGDQEQCEQPRVHAPPLSGSGETMRRSD